MRYRHTRDLVIRRVMFQLGVNGLDWLDLAWLGLSAGIGKKWKRTFQ